MSKKIKYSSIKQDETIDIAVAFSQAAALLDLVAKRAMYENDNVLMLEVADRWITIGSLFSSPEQVDELDTNSKTKFGFCPVEEGVEDDE